KKLLKGEEDEVLCEISYRKKDSRGRPQLTKAFLRIPKDIVRLKDQRVIKLTDLEPDETIKIFGRPAVYRVPHRGGVGGGVLTDGQDRQIQNAKAALAGKEGHIEVNKAFKDKQDPKLEWVDAQVEDTGGGLTVLYQGASYRVAMAKNAPIIRRGKAESKDFERKGTKYIYAVGNKSRERPTALGSADEKYDCFDAELVILLDGTSMRTAYPMIIEGF
ncbi:MAG: hypothetical protein JXA90_12175, partial [Planctomycetes bacterium]|nr:hypothetical protein [Planctomycetota bacterium]